MNQYLLPLGLNQFAPPVAPHDSPSSRLEAHGAEWLSDTELLSLLLQGGGLDGSSAAVIAAHLLSEAGSTQALLRWTAADYRRIPGIGQAKAAQLAAAGEFARRAFMTPASAAPVLDRPERIYQHLRPIVAGLTVEKFYVLSLNRRNRLIKCTEISSGTATAALAHPRECLREAMIRGAVVIAVGHNHPSGDPSPSAADLAVTRQLREACRAVDIELIDHVVVGVPQHDPTGIGYYSFRSAGIL